MRAVLTLLVFFAIIAAAAAAPAFAQNEPADPAHECVDGEADTPSGFCVPRFVTLKFANINGRAGPSMEHPIRWAYRRAGLPMEVIAEAPGWRRLRDPDGEIVWMNHRTLSGRRSVYVREETILRARADDDAAIEAIAEPGAVLSLERCRDGWCRIEAQGRRGWARTETLWGVYAHERGAAAQHEDGAVRGDSSAGLSGQAARDTALP